MKRITLATTAFTLLAFVACNKPTNPQIGSPESKLAAQQTPKAESGASVKVPPQPTPEIKFDVELGNLKPDSVLKFLRENHDRLARSIGRDSTLVIRGEGIASFYAKDERYVMNVTTKCSIRDDANQNILKEFTIPIETGDDFGQALGNEILTALKGSGTAE